MRLDYNSVDWGEIFELEYSQNGLKFKDGVKQSKFDASSGYLRYRYKSNRYLVHRIVFLLKNGDLSTDSLVDHIDGNSLNNHPDNLREVNKNLNMRNSKLSTRNVTGKCGVYKQTTKGFTYFVVQWNDTRRLRKLFRYTAVNEQEIFKQACEFRDNIIKSLGYTERHGTKDGT